MTIIIAIDGPAASGKTTVGYLLAKQLGYLLLDTGFMYRAVTLAALQKGIDITDEHAVVQLAQTIDIDVAPATNHPDGRMYTALLNGADVSQQLRTPVIDTHVLQVSRYAGVRQELVNRQRSFGQRGNLVMIGRDIGTVVIPDATLKLYVTAAPEERARRRWRDRIAQGHESEFNLILDDVIRRDELDSTRKHSPLRPADDAILIDSTDKSPSKIVVEILQLIPVLSNE